jgi:hypothetical protein
MLSMTPFLTPLLLGIILISGIWSNDVSYARQMRERSKRNAAARVIEATTNLAGSRPFAQNMPVAFHSERKVQDCS